MAPEPLLMLLVLLLVNIDQDLAKKDERVKGKKHITLVTLESPPFMMKKKIPEEVGDQGENKTIWYGYCMDFFLELIKYLPYELTYDIREVSDGKFGSKKLDIVEERVKIAGSNNTSTRFKKVESWNGLVGELARRKAHLALAPMAVMAERELEIDFTVPFYDLVGIQILLKRPDVAQNWFKFLTVLDNDVWFSIGIAYFVTSFIIYLFDRLSPYSNKNLARIKRAREKQRSRLRQLKNPLMVSGWQNNTLIMNNVNKANAGLKWIPPQIYPSDINSSDLDSPQINRQMNRFKTEVEGSSSTSDDDDEDVNGAKANFSLRDSLWFCITSLTPQGGGEAPQNLSGRVVAGAWWLFCFIVIASYTANLAAFLTVSRLDIPIESLDDLAKQYRIKYAPIDATAEQTYFERMAYIEEIFYNIWKEMSLNDSLSEFERSKFSVWDYPISDKYTKIWAQIQEVGMPSSIETALARVKSSTLDDGFALLADANLIKYAVMTDCSLKAVGEEFSRKPIALALAKDQEQLRDDISYAILQLINKRFMEVLREKWWTNNPARLACGSANSDDSEGISIENIGGVFIIILTGVLLSFVVWAIERFAYSTKVSVSRSLLDSKPPALTSSLSTLSFPTRPTTVTQKVS